MTIKKFVGQMTKEQLEESVILIADKDQAKKIMAMAKRSGVQPLNDSQIEKISYPFFASFKFGYAGYSNILNPYEYQYLINWQHQWCGNGIPPVGTECRYDYIRSRTSCSGVCEILGYHGDQVWFKPRNAKHVSMPVSDVHFYNPQGDCHES